MASDRLPRRTILALVAIAGLTVLLDVLFGGDEGVRTDGGEEWRAVRTVSLPTPNEVGDRSVEEAVTARRSRREYGERALSRRELGQLLWAAQGVTDRASGHRAAPSAGALYPLELYVVIGTSGVVDLESGVYRYRPTTHELARGKAGEFQSELRAAALDQRAVEEAAVDIVVCAVDERMTGTYGERGRRRYVPMEAGHVGENLYLQAESLALSTVAIGAFDDDRVRAVVGAPSGQRPLYVFPVGAR